MLASLKSSLVIMVCNSVGGVCPFKKVKTVYSTVCNRFLRKKPEHSAIRILINALTEAVFANTTHLVSALAKFCIFYSLVFILTNFPTNEQKCQSESDIQFSNNSSSHRHHLY